MNRRFEVNRDANARSLEFETLIDVTNSLVCTDSHDQLFKETLEKISAVLDASAGIIFLSKEDTDIFEPTFFFNVDLKSLTNTLFTTKRGLLALLVQERQAIIIDNSIDSIFQRLGASYGLAAPLLQKDNVIGSILLLDKETRKGISSFVEADKVMLYAFANQLSIAYNNQLLFNSLKESKIFNENLIDSMTTGVFTINLFGEINLINNAACDILSVIKLHTIHNHYSYIFDEIPELKDFLEAAEQEITIKKELGLQVLIGSVIKTINLSFSPITDKQDLHTGSVITIEDVTNVNKLKSTFKKYVSKNIVEKILEQEDNIALGGNTLNATILFSDIRGFTAIAEKMEPLEVVNTLNEYFSLMIDVVFQQNGTLDKIIGDALMIIFGAPLQMDDDSHRAVKAALQMIKALEQFNADRIQRGLFPIEIGIGINTGKVIAGNIGSKEQMNYTVIGDAVNIASRLCSVAKSGEIVISEIVKSQVENSFKIEPYDKIKLKGKSTEMQLYSVLQ